MSNTIPVEPRVSPLKIISFLILLVLLSFLRESFFLHLNAHIGIKEGHYTPFSEPDVWHFMGNFNLSALYLIKWIFTAIFACLFLLLALLSVRWFFSQHQKTKTVYTVYISTFLLSAIAILLGWLIPVIKESSYYFARWLMGAAQSPVLNMLLVILFYAEKKGKLKLVQSNKGNSLS